MVKPPKPARGIRRSRGRAAAVRLKSSLAGLAMGKPESMGTLEMTFLATEADPKRREEKALERVDWNCEGRGGMGGQAEGKRFTTRAEVTAD